MQNFCDMTQYAISDFFGIVHKCLTNRKMPKPGTNTSNSALLFMK